MPTTHIARFDALQVDESSQLEVLRAIPGAKYGFKIWNHPETYVQATASDTIDTIWSKLADELTNAGLDVTDHLVSGVNGLSTGLRIVGSPGCYVVPVVAAVAPVGKSITVQLPASTTGGTFGLSFNFGFGVESATLNADTDVATMTSTLAALATPGTGDLVVNLLSSSPLKYQITGANNLLGDDFTVTGTGTGLTGTGTCEITTVQTAGDAARKVQVCWFQSLPVASGELQIRFMKNGLTSSWVSSVNSYYTDARVAGWIRDAVWEVTGSNVVTVTTVLDVNSAGGVFLVNRDAGDSGDVTIQCRYFPVGSTTPVSYSTSNEVLRAAGANESEIQLVRHSGSDYDVTFGSTTETVLGTANETVLTTHWETLAGSGNVSIFGATFSSSPRVYAVCFKGSRANADQSQATSPDATITTLIDGHAINNQITQIVITASSGTIRFTADAGSNYTSDLAYNASSSTLQTALRGLAAIGSGNVNVSGAGTRSNPYLVEGVSGLAATSFTIGHDLDSSNDLVGGYSPTITTVQEASAGVNQVDRLVLDPYRSAGYIVPVIDGSPGNRVAYNGTASAWDSALQSVSGITTAVVSSGSDEFLVTWSDFVDHQLVLDVSQLTVTGSSLISMVRVTEATGPNRWNEPKNWSTGQVPGYGDTVILRDGNQAILDGLVQRCSWTRDTATNDLRLGTSVDESGDFAVGQVVRLATTNTLPTATLAGSPLTLSSSTDYFVVAYSKSRRTMSISTTAGGEAIEITGSGTGTHTVLVTLAALYRHQSWEGDVGYSRRYGNGLQERPRALAVNCLHLEVGLESQGSGPGIEVYDLGDVAAAVLVRATSGSSSRGEMPLQVLCDSTGTNFDVKAGYLGIDPDALTSEKSVGTVSAVNAALQFGKVSAASLDLQATTWEAPYGISVRSSSGMKVRP